MGFVDYSSDEGSSDDGGAGAGAGAAAPSSVGLGLGLRLPPPKASGGGGLLGGLLGNLPPAKTSQGE
jgi:hypothetical protein